LKTAAYVFVTHSEWGGWHHTEIHNGLWWRQRWESWGFVYQPELTAAAKAIAQTSNNRGLQAWPIIGRDGSRVAHVRQ
jgi:hypothetical protein